MDNIRKPVSGKTLSAPIVQTQATTSTRFWLSSQDARGKKFQYLCLTEESGKKPVPSSSHEGVSHGAQWTRSTGAYHSAGDALPSFSYLMETMPRECFLNVGESPVTPVESKLSWVLERNAGKEFYLSSTACRGILRRASARGKVLPTILKTALEDMIAWWGSSPPQSAKVLNDQGGGSIHAEKGDLSPTLRAESHQHEPVVCIGADIYNGALTGDKTGTLRAKSADADHVPCAVEQLAPIGFMWQVGPGAAMPTAEELSPTLVVNQVGISAYASNSMKSPNPHSGVYKAETSRTLDAAQCCFPACNQGGIAVCAPVIYQTDEKVGTLNAAGYEKNGTQEAMQGLYVVETPLVYDARGNGDGRLCSTLTGDHQSRVTDYTALAVEPTSWDGSQTVATLTASNADGSQRMPDIHNFNCVLEPVIGIDRAAFNQGANAQYDFQTLEEQQPTLTARGPGAVCAPSYGVDVRNYAVNGELYPTMTTKPNGGQSLNYSGAVLPRVVRWIVRRLTPDECCSLQGFPRGWCDIGEWTDDNGKRHKDAMSPKYKALGNSIALPQWWWLMCRLEPYLGDNPTLGSLFDGIGGFPLVFETKYGKGTARWASEIEPFPIAVTKFHFPEPEGWYEDWMG